MRRCSAPWSPGFIWKHITSEVLGALAAASLAGPLLDVQAKPYVAGRRPANLSHWL